MYILRINSHINFQSARGDQSNPHMIDPKSPNALTLKPQPPHIPLHILPLHHLRNTIPTPQRVGNPPRPVPRAHNDPFLPPGIITTTTTTIHSGDNRHPLARHGPPAHALPHDLKITTQQLLRRPLQRAHALGVDDAFRGGGGKRVGARVEAREVDAAVGQAGEDFGAVARVGVGGEDGVAFLLVVVVVVAAADRFVVIIIIVDWVGTVKYRGRPVRGADDERVSR